MSRRKARPKAVPQETHSIALLPSRPLRAVTVGASRVFSPRPRTGLFLPARFGHTPGTL